MKQPELGKKMAELRKQKGLTQEDLAFKANVNVRSIQRIENGEVTPRPSTLRLLAQPLEWEIDVTNSQEIKLWLALLHFTNMIPIIVIALIIWIDKRNTIPEINRHGRDVINFQISMCIYLFSASMLAIILIGVPILILLGWYTAFITIFNMIRVAMDNDYKYPLTIEFIK